MATQNMLRQSDHDNSASLIGRVKQIGDPAVQAFVLKLLDISQLRGAQHQQKINDDFSAAITEFETQQTTLRAPVAYHAHI